jgi:hypothetical protein
MNLQQDPINKAIQNINCGNSQQDAMNRAMNNLSGTNLATPFYALSQGAAMNNSMQSRVYQQLPMTMASYDPTDPIILARAKQRKARQAAQA